ncbi:MAG TPA: pilin [bacterium]|nr:pilin [bacterium]HPV65769.1 pilin [bacterium]
MFRKIIIVSFSFLILFFSSFSVSLAQTTQDNVSQPTTVKLSNPLGAGATAQSVIGNVIDKVLGVVGALALIMFIYGGITWMTAMGNEQQISKGKDILMWSALGLVVIFSSYALVKFVLQAIGA